MLERNHDINCTEKISPAKPGLELLNISHRETGETEIHTVELWKFKVIF